MWVIERKTGRLPTFNGNKLIEVVWEGKVVMMFTQDVRLRAERIE
jgi:hypothetical protein